MTKEHSISDDNRENPGDDGFGEDDSEERLSIEEYDRLRKEEADKWLREVEETIALVEAERAATGCTKRLITRQELLDAGALVLPSMRSKTLNPRPKKAAKPRERLLFDDLQDDEETPQDE